MQNFTITSDLGVRSWSADTAEHALEQHYDSFATEPVKAVTPHTIIRGPQDPDNESHELTHLYWSNADGWVDRTCATVFEDWPRSLPEGTDGLELATEEPTYIDVRQLNMPALDTIENEDLEVSIRLALATLRAATTYFGDRLGPTIDALTRGDLTLDSDSEAQSEIHNLARNVIADIALAADHLGIDAELLLKESEEIFTEECPTPQLASSPPSTQPVAVNNAAPVAQINEATWHWVLENEPCSIPRRAQFDDGGRWENCPVLAFCFAADGRLTMMWAYPSLHALTTDSNHCPEAPTYAIDLTEPPETARIPLHSTLHVGTAGKLDD